jgi:hypothetical protein
MPCYIRSGVPGNASWAYRLSEFYPNEGDIGCGSMICALAAQPLEKLTGAATTPMMMDQVLLTARKQFDIIRSSDADRAASGCCPGTTPRT